MKKNIYINEGEVKREGNALKIGPRKIPLSLIENVFLFEKVKMNKSARNLLLRNKRAIIYLNWKYELLGILLPEFFKSDMRKRIWQYENRNNLYCARFIISKKIEQIENFGVDLSFAKFKLLKAMSLNEILGIEGIISKLMFDKFKKELRMLGIKDFKKRTYNPPTDRINGVLSFLYTLYYSFVFSEIIANGFDPYIGFLHRKRGTHAVFASDVMEEARVLLTFESIELIKSLYPHSFDGLYLNLEGRKKLLKFFDRFIENYDNTILKTFKERKC